MTKSNTYGLNRAYEIRRDDEDLIRIPPINIHDVDYAILHHLSNDLELTVNEEGKIKKVPIIYSNPELWAQVQSNGFMRDNKNKLMSPLLVIRRTSMTRDNRIRKLGVNNAPKASKLRIYPGFRNLNNANSRSKLQNVQESVQFFYTVFPEFYFVDYELVIWTQRQDQMNMVVEDIIPTNNYMWGDQFKFKVQVNDPQFTQVNSSKERLVKCTVPIQAWAKLVDSFEMKKSNVERAFSIKRLVLQNERSSFDIKAVPTDTDLDNIK